MRNRQRKSSEEKNKEGTDEGVTRYNTKETKRQEKDLKTNKLAVKCLLHPLFRQAVFHFLFLFSFFCRVCAFRFEFARADVGLTVLAFYTYCSLGLENGLITLFAAFSFFRISDFRFSFSF